MTDSSSRRISYDCRHFLGDRPCYWHKRHGLICECEHYGRIARELLIIKLDAMGDVLRTTCLLPVIKKAWPDHRISWITLPACVSLLQNNPYVDEVIPYGPDAILFLCTRKFHRVISLDAGRISAAMAALARSDQKIGFILQEGGWVTSTNAAAEHWLRMGIFDDIKRLNTRTYQEVMCSILGLPTHGLKYILRLTDEERKGAHVRLARARIDSDGKLIGIHTGGGGRWRLKQWHEKGFVELIRRLVAERGLQVILFGGPLEKETNERIIAEAGVPLFDAGCDNEVRHFAALVQHCSVMLSGDSLAMHVALAVGTRVAVIFGPTSAAEIELFDMGEKVFPKLDCLACYKQDCNFAPNCMDSITVDMVEQAVLRQLGRVQAAESVAEGEPIAPALVDRGR